VIQASIIYRAHVPGSLTDSLDREKFPVRTCVRLRWRAYGEINPGLNRTRNPASHQSARHLLPAGGNLRTAIERTRTQISLAVRIFLQCAGTIARRTVNFCRPISAAGKPTFLPFVHDANQPANGLVNRFSLSKILSSACLHANNKAWSRQHEAQRNSASRASGA
jgi:hypothetical protein